MLYFFRQWLIKHDLTLRKADWSGKRPMKVEIALVFIFWTLITFGNVMLVRLVEFGWPIFRDHKPL